MLLDYVSRAPAEQPEEGIRVAGLLDLARLVKALGQTVDEGAMTALRGAAKADPLGTFTDQRAFIDPMGRLMLDSGPTYEGKPLRRYKSFKTLQDRGQSLREYLDGTQMGDMLGSQMEDIRVGITDMGGNMSAAFISPRGGRPGLLAIGDTMPKDAIPQLFEHEMQHAYQSMLGQPRGTNLDEMTGPMTEYLTEIGVLRPAQLARIDRDADAAGISKPTARYYATTGEAEARAAELRQQLLMQGIEEGYRTPPTLDQYQFTGTNYSVGPNDFFAIPQDADVGFHEWWQRRNQRGN